MIISPEASLKPASRAAHLPRGNLKRMIFKLGKLFAIVISTLYEKSLEPSSTTITSRFFKEISLISLNSLGKDLASSLAGITQLKTSALITKLLSRHYVHVGNCPFFHFLISLDPSDVSSKYLKISMSCVVPRLSVRRRLYLHFLTGH